MGLRENEPVAWLIDVLSAVLIAALLLWGLVEFVLWRLGI